MPRTAPDHRAFPKRKKRASAFARSTDIRRKASIVCRGSEAACQTLEFDHLQKAAPKYLLFESTNGNYAE